MSFDYASLRDLVVQPLLKDFGVTGILLLPGVTTGPDYDPQPGDDVSQSVFVVETEFTKEDMAGGNVQKDDKMFLISTENVIADPNMADRLQISGTIYQVVEVKTLKPGPTTMLWQVHVRK